MANQKQELESLLDERDTLVSLNPTIKRACLPTFGDDDVQPSQLAYFACTTLRSLATAPDDALWEIYGDIISKWPGTTTQCARAGLHEQKEFVQVFQRQTDPEETARTVLNIRKALATVDLKHISPTSLPAFIRHVFGDEEALHRATALHHRSEEGKDTIYILPFLLHVELLIEESIISPTKSNLPGRDMDVAIVAIAKAVLHETRHVVGTLIHGTEYSIPRLSQGDFSPPLEPGAMELPTDWEQGEAGDWYEVSRYGSFATPALVSPTSDPEYASLSLALVGREENNNHPLRYLMSSTVKDLADRVRNGTFIIPKRFFRSDCTLNVVGYVVDLVSLNSTIPSQPIPPTQTSFRQTALARYSGPHFAERFRSQPVDGITDVRKLGFGNYRGVLMDRPSPSV